MSVVKQYFGYNAPFRGGQQNFLSFQSGDRIIKNDLIQLILTSRGERVMRPNFGTNLRRMLFRQMSDDLVATIETDISEAIAKQEPRISATVRVSRKDDENTLTISVTGFYTDRPNEAFQAEVNVPLDMGDTR